MRKILLYLQFNGAAYHGYQKQENLPTIENEVNIALSKLLNEFIQVSGCSRLDKGVSAYKFALTFETISKLPENRFCTKLNNFLPKDIRSYASFEVPLSFHVRKSLISKTYQYAIYSSPVVLPLLSKEAYYIKEKLDIEKIKECISILEGKHNFNAFRNITIEQPLDYKNTIKTIYKIDLYVEDVLKIKITADNFLYNMARLIVSVLIEVGTSRMSVATVKEMIETGLKKKSLPTPPARFLFLKDIQYNEEGILF